MRKYRPGSQRNQYKKRISIVKWPIYMKPEWLRTAKDEDYKQRMKPQNATRNSNKTSKHLVVQAHSGKPQSSKNHHAKCSLPKTKSGSACRTQKEWRKRRKQAKINPRPTLKEECKRRMKSARNRISNKNTSWSQRTSPQ